MSKLLPTVNILLVIDCKHDAAKRNEYYISVQKLRNSEKSLGNLFYVKKVEPKQGCKSQYYFLNISSVFIQNLRAFDLLVEKWNKSKHLNAF